MEKKNYLVRKNCEYSVLVSAESEEAAINEADKTPLAEWDTAWSCSEVED